MLGLVSPRGREGSIGALCAPGPRVSVSEVQPQLINFLLGVLYIAAPNKPSQVYTLMNPFRARGKSWELLLVFEEEVMAFMAKEKPLPALADGLEAKSRLSGSGKKPCAHVWHVVIFP